MSRMGRLPVAVPSGVQVALVGAILTAKGKQGELSLTLSDAVAVSIEDDKVWIKPTDDSRHARVMWGTARSLVNNLVIGVGEGYVYELQIEGVGYRAAVQGKDLVLQLGFSHEIKHPIPDGVVVAVENQRAIKLSGADKQQVSQLAAVIRRYRPPEPYKGKGIRRKGEQVRRKEGKKK
ncbi:MAG: 50S ribosomal protein L6 [Alphaproteobacteria bacterium]